MKEEHFFYTPKIRESNLLPDEEFAHAVRVLRFGVGDHIHLMDGVGYFYDAQIKQVTKKFCEFEVVNEVFYPRKNDAWLHVAMAPTKNIDRTEWFVEKAVEIGVDEITFLDSEFSERKRINLERMDKIIVSAMKQSRKPYKTILNPLTDFSHFIANAKENRKFICHCYGNDNAIELKEKILLRDSLSAGDRAVVMVGPEGDFSLKEVAAAENLEFQSVSLGESRLRTETAAVVAVHILNLFT